jgi:hypothetical protein
VAVLASLDVPKSVAVDMSGNVYIATAGRVVRMVNASTGHISTFAGTGAYGASGDGGNAKLASFVDLTGLAIDSTGNVYIVDSSSQQIRMVDTSGIISTVAGNGTMGFSGDGGLAIGAELYYPTTVACDSLGNLYIADSYNNRIRKVNSTGFISTLAILQYPRAVACDRNDSVYAAFQSCAIGKVDTTTGLPTFLAGDPNSCGNSGDGGLALNARFTYSSTGLAADSQGNIYISDNNRVRVLTRLESVGTGFATTGFITTEAVTTAISLVELTTAPSSTTALTFATTGSNTSTAVSPQVSALSSTKIGIIVGAVGAGVALAAVATVLLARRFSRKKNQRGVSSVHLEIINDPTTPYAALGASTSPLRQHGRKISAHI